MIKIKYPNFYNTLISTNFERHFCEELKNNKNIEIVDENDFSDISINILTNTKLSILLDKSDPHSKIYDINANDLVIKKFADLLDLLNISDNQRNLIKNPYEYFKKNSGKTWNINDVDKYDIFAPYYFAPYKDFITKLQHAKPFFVPISLPENIFYFNNDIKDTDVFFAGAIYNFYPLRIMFYKKLEELKDINSKIFNRSGASAVSEIKIITEYDNQLMDYANNLRKAKITLIDGGIFNYPVKKYIESMACGCLVLAPLPEGSEELGFIDGETMIEVNHLNFEEKLRYYLSHNEERERIINNAYNLFKEKYTCKKSIEIILNKLSQFI